MPKMPLPPAESMKLDSLAEVARGGMGSVELARVVEGPKMGQILAVKRLHSNIAEDPEFVSMFLDEAWMTAALKHPNVAQVVAWGNDDKGMFLAIELVQGVSLSRLLKEAQQNQEPFAERTVANICSQICAGLTAAHTLAGPDGVSLGLVHRDLSPANVLVSFDGVVKIIDFGIARAEERISHTRTGQMKGKPAYMAPEQQRPGNVDARADLFAFGVLMFEMLAGRRPWMARGAFDVMMEISNDPHPDLGELRKGLNPEFVAICHKCLAKKPDDRFNTASEIKARLDGWLAAKGFSSDDQHSLAQFVLRNSQPQVLWWQEALRGEHAKKKAPTFKELEERIDEERERKSKAARKAVAAPPRPAAGTLTVKRAPAALSGTVPMQAYRGPASVNAPDSSNPPSSGPVSSGQQLPPSSGNPLAPGRTPSMMGLSPSPLSAGHQAGSGQYAAVPQPQAAWGTPVPVPVSERAADHPSQPPSQPGAQLSWGTPEPVVRPPSSGANFGSGQYAAQAAPVSASSPAKAGSGQYAAQAAPASLPKFGSGTEFMAISPFANQAVSSQAQPPQAQPAQPQPAQPPPVASVERSAVSVHGVPQAPYAMSAPAPTLDHTLNDPGTMPMGPGLLLPSMTHPLPRSASVPGAGVGAPQDPYGAAVTAQERSAHTSTPPPRRRSRVGLVLALLVMVLGGAGAGLWFFGDRIGVNLGEWGLGASPKPR